MDQITIYKIGLPIFFGLLILEAIVTSWKGLGIYEKRDSAANMTMLFFNILGNLGSKGAVLGLYFYLYQFHLLDIDSLPVWAQWLTALVLIDFTFYWYHRCSHRVRFFWAVHVNHHSSEHYNFAVAFRQALFGSVSKVPFFLFLPLIGLDPLLTMAAGAFLTLWGVWGHTQVIGKLGPMEWIFNTPSHHRVHHGSNPEYIDKNFGNFLIIWDRMFGTFAEEKAKVRYGLVNNINTFNPIKITFHHWVSLIKDMKAAPSMADAIHHLWGAPEWVPASVNAIQNTQDSTTEAQHTVTKTAANHSASNAAKNELVTEE